MDSRSSRKSSNQAVRLIENDASPAIEEHLLQLGVAQRLESIENHYSESLCAMICVERETPKRLKNKTDLLNENS
jgi:hypothetical protein